MKRVFVAFISAVFSCSAALSTQASAQSIEETTRGSAVTVTSSTTTVRGYGAGVVVAVAGTTVRVLTAKHVVSVGPTITVALPDSAPTLATIVYAYPDRDLAVLETNVSPAVAANVHAVAFGAPHGSREGLHLWGESLGMLGLEHGSVAILGETLPDGPAAGRFAFACAECHEGDSGAGVFASDGSLVGIYLGYYMQDGRQGLSLATLPAPAVAFAKIGPAPSTVALAAQPSAAGAVAATLSTDETETLAPRER